MISGCWGPGRSTTTSATQGSSSRPSPSTSAPHRHGSWTWAAGVASPGSCSPSTWAEAEGRLLDGQLRRVRFLLDALEDLGIDDRVEAVHGRAEELAHEPAFRQVADVVTARSFAATGDHCECGVAFLRPGGVLLVAEPPEEVGDRWPADPLESLGLIDAGITRSPAGSVRCLRLAGDLAPRSPAAPRRCSADPTSDLGVCPRTPPGRMFHGEHPGGTATLGERLLGRMFHGEHRPSP